MKVLLRAASEDTSSGSRVVTLGAVSLAVAAMVGCGARCRSAEEPMQTRCTCGQMQRVQVV